MSTQEPVKDVLEEAGDRKEWRSIVAK